MAVSLYYIIVADGSTAPTAAQIVAGVDYGAVTVLAAGSVAYTTAGTYDADSDPVTGASASTSYDQYWTSYDGTSYGNVVQGAVTTLGVDGTATGVTLRAAARFLGGGATGVRNATVGGVALRAAARFVAGGAVGTGAAVASGATLRAVARFTGGGASAVRNPTVAGVTLRAALRFNGGGAFVPGDGGYRHGRLNVRIGLGL
jgi:hypothetical protein